MTTTCRVCGVAPLGAGDRYCFYCGTPLRRLEVEPALAAVVLRGEDPAEAWLEGVLWNRGQLEATARLLPPERPWVKVFPQAEAAGPTRG
ncbi:MAG TPA: hypothetical protein VJT67_13125, partial [Longimicrobiaceae bacterium]|nr:hypothetical protein [Longimicrobiaceae bacterium]